MESHKIDLSHRPISNKFWPAGLKNIIYLIETTNNFHIYSFICNILFPKNKALQLKDAMSIIQLFNEVPNWPTSVVSLDQRFSTAGTWRPGLNFINILCTAFTLADPKSIKRCWLLNCIFYTFGSYGRKSCT